MAIWCIRFALLKKRSNTLYSEKKALANEFKATNNLKWFMRQEADRFLIDAETYNQSKHIGYAAAALDSVQLIQKEYFPDSLPLQRRINSIRLRLK